MYLLLVKAKEDVKLCGDFDKLVDATMPRLIWGQ